jgi:nucleoside-diphosphate-sugar epimerase
MKILFTGASSFTGFWFVKELHAAGHEIVATFTGTQDSYQGIKRQRLEMLSELCQPEFSCAFGSEAFLALIAEHKDFAVLCHHGAQVSNYKSFNFPVVSAVAENTFNILAVLEALLQYGARSLVLTASVFEPREGLGHNSGAVSPYGLSKGLSSEIFRYYTEALRFPLGTFVIPNPFGPLEEPRFVSYLMSQWFTEQVACVNTPHYIRDNIHVSLLAKAYAHFVARCAHDPRNQRFNPSGYIMSQGAFTLKLAEEMRPRLNKACEVKIAPQGKHPEPAIRINSDPVAQLFPEWQEEAAFDALATYYLGMHHGI